MNWTTRLRRHGGLHQLTSRRAYQFQLLAAVPSYSRRGPEAAELLRWLEANPLRVLSAEEESLFGGRPVIVGKPPGAPARRLSVGFGGFGGAP